MTPKEAALLSILTAAGDQLKPTPTYEQLASALGLASKSGVCRLIAGLEAKGYIARAGRGRIGLRVIRRRVAAGCAMYFNSHKGFEIYITNDGHFTSGPSSLAGQAHSTLAACKAEIDRFYKKNCETQAHNRAAS